MLIDGETGPWYENQFLSKSRNRQGSYAIQGNRNYLSAVKGKTTDRPKVSIVIPTYNRRMSLKGCLDSLIKQTYRNFEVIVVDGGSTDSTRELVYEYSLKLPIIFSVQKGGLVLKMNEGLRISRGEIVIRTDDDVIADSNWLWEIVNTFAVSQNVGGVTGPTIIPEDRLQNRDVFTFLRKFADEGLLWELARSIYIKIFLEGKPHYVGRVFKSGAWAPGSNFPTSANIKNLVDVDTLEACNMALRKSLIEKVHGFDDTYRTLAEWSEVDLCFRIRKLGYKLIFNPKAVVFHMVSHAGIFIERTHAYDRMVNFIHFYLNHIKPNTLDKALRFGLYLVFLNCYWMYKFARSGNPDYLTGVSGTIAGLLRKADRAPE